MTKMEQIKFFLSVLPYYILGVLQGLVHNLKRYIKTLKIMSDAKKNHRAVCYHEVKEGLMFFVKNFIIKQTPTILHTKEGKLLLVHGSPSTKMPFVIGGIPAGEIEAISGIEKGNYILVSCHNEFHQDIDLNGIKAIREPNTISRYPILCVFNPFTKKIWLTSNKKIGQICADLQQIDINLIEEGFDNNIWKDTEEGVRILKEDEVPEFVKKQIQY